MAELTPHWTERTTQDFLFRLAADFIRQIETVMERDQVSRHELAQRLSVTNGRVSQLLNNPGNLTLKKIIEYSRVLGQKAAIVAYDDGDPRNAHGPINAEVFTRCWEMMSKPRDAFDLTGHLPRTQTFYVIQPFERSAITFRYEQHHLPFNETAATTTKSLVVQ